MLNCSLRIYYQKLFSVYTSHHVSDPGSLHHLNATYLCVDIIECYRL